MYCGCRNISFVETRDSTDPDAQPETQFAKIVKRKGISLESVDLIRLLLPTTVSPFLLRLLLTSQLVSLVRPYVEKLKENLWRYRKLIKFNPPDKFKSFGFRRSERILMHSIKMANLCCNVILLGHWPPIKMSPTHLYFRT